MLLGFYAEGKYPDLKSILIKCREDPNFPQIGKTTLHKWLTKKCKMKFRRINKKPVYLERNDIRLQRENYLRSVRKYRKLGYKIFYSDETWTSPDQARHTCWQMLLSDSEFNDLFRNTYQGQVLRDMNSYTGMKQN